MKMNLGQLVNERIGNLESDDDKTRAKAEDLLDRFYAEYKNRSQTYAVGIYETVESFYRANRNAFK